MSKFKSKKITIDGIAFASKVEGAYYKKLKLDKYHGLILNFEMQPKFIIQPAFTNSFDKKIQAITLVADFIVYNLDDTQTIIDVKGYPTEGAKLKRKMFNYVYRGEELVWVCWYGKDWVTFEEMVKIKAIKKKVKDLGK